jgi:hypothetical protein
MMVKMFKDFTKDIQKQVNEFQENMEKKTLEDTEATK